MLKPSDRVIQYRFFDCRLPVLLDTLTREEQCSFAKEVIVSVCMKDDVFFVFLGGKIRTGRGFHLGGYRDGFMIVYCWRRGQLLHISTVNTTSPESKLDTCTMEKYHRSQKR